MLWFYGRVLLTASLLTTAIAKCTERLEPCRPTGPAVEGPFFEPNEPKRNPLCTGDSQFYSQDVTRLVVSGTLWDEDCQMVVPGAKIEIWQADSSGYYRDQSLCRSAFHTDSFGCYKFTTLHPGKYRTGSGFRPAHIHFKVTHPEGWYHPLTTQLYFEGDKHLFPHDSCRGCSSNDRSLIIQRESLEANVNGSMWFSGEFNIVLRRTRNWRTPTLPFKCPTTSIPTTEEETTTSVPRTEGSTASSVSTTEEETTSSVPRTEGSTTASVSTTSNPTSSAQPSPKSTVANPTTSAVCEDCPKINPLKVDLTSDFFQGKDYVFQIKVRRNQKDKRGRIVANLAQVFKVSVSLMEDFELPLTLKIVCSNNCAKCCRKALAPGKKIIVAGLKKDLKVDSKSARIMLSPKSMICPWKDCKRPITKYFSE